MRNMVLCSKIVLVIILTSMISIFGCSSDSSSEWVQISTKSISGSLTETVWNLNRYPYGSYDKIGARRLIKDGIIEAKAVVVYLPPSFTKANLYTDASLPDDNEKYDFRLYLANRDYDIFSLDYRTSFVPSGATDLSFMADWGKDVFLSDIQTIIQFAKEKTGVDKVFIAGHSSGGHYVYLYAAERWSEDLKGMIVLDSAPWETEGDPAELKSISLSEINSRLAAGNSPENRAYFKAMGLTADVEKYYNVELTSFDKAFGPAVELYSEDPTFGPFDRFDTVSDYIANQYQKAWGDAQLTNVENGYATVGMLLSFNITTKADNWPLFDYAEEAYIGNWDGNTKTGKGHNLRGKLSEVDVPIIVFASEKWTTFAGLHFEWKAMGPTLIKSSDREYHLLEGFGHLDVLIGEFAKDLVYSPMYNWLETHL